MITYEEAKVFRVVENGNCLFQSEKAGDVLDYLADRFHDLFPNHPSHQEPDYQKLVFFSDMLIREVSQEFEITEQTFYEPRSSRLVDETIEAHYTPGEFAKENL